MFKDRDTASSVGSVMLNYSLMSAGVLGDARAASAALIGYGVEQRDADMRTLHRLAFIFHADRLRLQIEEAVRMFLERKPSRAITILPDHPIWQKEPLDAAEIAIAVAKAGDKLVVGSYRDIAARLSKIFNVDMMSPSEMSYCNYIAEVRNLFVHRGEDVDKRFATRTRSSKPVGMRIVVNTRHLVSLSIRIPHRIENRLD